MSSLPVQPFPGQEFIDAFRVVWRFDGDLQCWVRTGTASDIPLASDDQPGLLSSKQKGFLDSIPSKGGGFGIVVDPKLAVRSESNPDGIIFGDVELISNSLDIDCVFSDGTSITKECKNVKFSPEVDEQPPGFDFSFSDEFLSTICAEIPGGPGPKGEKGIDGDDGDPGTGDGPQGIQGESGDDAVEVREFTGIKVEDVSDIFDTSVVNLELDRSNALLHVAKGKIKVPDDDTPADQVIATSIFRSLEFNNGFGFTVLKPQNQDELDADALIGVYPSSFTKESKDELIETQFITKKISEYMTDVTGFYQNRLNGIADEYDSEIEEFIKQTDEDARQKLDILTEELANCEFRLPLEYCVGISPADCHQGASAGSPSAGNSMCSLSAILGGSTEYCAESEGTSFGNFTIISGDVIDIATSGDAIGVVTLPEGLYIIVYIGGTFYDPDGIISGNPLPICGHVVSAGGIVIDGGTTVQTDFISPITPDPDDRFDSQSVENAYLAAPIQDRSIILNVPEGAEAQVFAPVDSDGQFIISIVTGSLKFQVIHCKKCI